MALPAAGLPVALRRLRSRAWAVVAPVSIGAAIAAVAAWSGGAELLAWVSLLLVPPGCAIALGWAARGSHPWLAPLALPLLGVALAVPDALAGELARIALIGGSCVTLGRLLAGAAPAPLLKAGVLAMACADAVVVFGHLFAAQNAQFAAAAPGAGLPQLHVADLGRASCDYGDFFAAGLVGGILAARPRRQLAAALAVLLVTQLFNQLFLVVDTLPATVPPALVLVGAELWPRLAARASAGTSAARLPTSSG